MSYSNVKEWTTAIADAIRQQEGSSETINHEDFPDRILDLGLDWFDITSGNYDKNVVIDGESIEGLQITPYLFQNKDLESVECVIRHPVTQVTLTNVRVGAYAFSGNENLQSAIVPSFKSLAERCFWQCDLSGELDFSGVETISKNAFTGINATTLKFPNCSTVESIGLGSINAINRIEFGEAISIIADQSFWYDGSLTALVIRKTTSVPTLSGARAFTGTPIAAGTGYIYVPSSLIEQYKVGTNWFNFADQFRALENYTTDGTINGDLDPTKI